MIRSLMMIIGKIPDRRPFQRKCTSERSYKRFGFALKNVHFVIIYFKYKYLCFAEHEDVVRNVGGRADLGYH